MDKKIIEDFDRKEKANKLRHKKAKQDSHGSRNIKKSKVEDTPLASNSTYRDRADERRHGINKDFEHDPEDLRIQFGNSAFDDGEPIPDDESRRIQEIEDSKYLGGDVKHTHLVKGLDFALAQKMKKEQKQEEKLAAEKPPDHGIILGDFGSDSEEEEFRMNAIFAATDLSQDKRKNIDLDRLKRGQTNEAVPCRTNLARRIINVLQEKYTTKSDLFLPGRMTYIMPLDDDCDDTGVTTLVRSKADIPNCPTIDEDNEKDIPMDYIINKLERIRKGESASDDITKRNHRTLKKRYEDEIDDY